MRVKERSDVEKEKEKEDGRGNMRERRMCIRKK